MPEEPQVIIMVVEDDEVCSRLAIRQLTHLGFRAHTCANGREAIEQLSRGSYYLILMDLQMPVMGGVEATRAIRELEKKTRQHVPIIAVTANPDRDLCLKAGMDDFLFKPASLAELTEVLNRWLPKDKRLAAIAHKETRKEELEEEREKGLEERRITQEERAIIQKRREDIEQRRKEIAANGSNAAVNELPILEDEVSKLQDRIVALHWTTQQQRDDLAELKKRANGIWHELSLFPEESQQRQENLQTIAESIQKLQEDVQHQEEQWEKRKRQGKGSPPPNDNPRKRRGARE